MSSINNSSPSHEEWDKADLFFLTDALKRGMSIEEVARFLNRSQEEVRRRAALHERSEEWAGKDSKPPPDSCLANLN